MAFVAVLDANVFYSITIRNLCLNFASHGFYRAVWTDQISNEWTRNLPPRVPIEKAKEISSKIDDHFAECILKPES